MNGLNIFLCSVNTIFAHRNSWDMLSETKILSLSRIVSIGLASFDTFNSGLMLMGISAPPFKVLYATFRLIEIGLAYKTPKREQNRDFSARMFCNALCASRLFLEMKGITSFIPQEMEPLHYAWNSLISFEIAARLYQSRKQLFPKTVSAEISLEDLKKQDLALLEGRFQEVLEIPERYLARQFKPMIPICPITQRPVRFPVIDPTCNKVFESAPLYEWVRKHKTSPLTRQPLQVEELKVCKKSEQWISIFLTFTQNFLKKRQEENVTESEQPAS